MTAILPAEIRTYAGWPESQYSDAQILDAIAAETAAQAAVCKVPEVPSPALGQALMRRVVRNLHMRAVPLGVQADEAGGIRIGTNDPEIRRLEGPYRRRRVG